MSQTFNFGDALNRSMDEIEDLPEIIIPPNGSYQVTVTKVKQKDGDKPSISFMYRLDSVLEISGSDEPPAIGSLFMENFFVNTEMGLPMLKRHLKDVAEKTGNGNIGELLQQVEGNSFAVTVKQRPYVDKTTKEKKIGFNTLGLVCV